MKDIFIFPAIALFTCGLTLFAIKIEKKSLIYIFKTLTSLLFVLTALSAGIKGDYNIRIFLGLICGLAGDILLVEEKKSYFLGGLLSFLAGHILYISAFLTIISFKSLNLYAFFAIITISFCFLIIFWNYIKEIRFPVILYVFVISTMLLFACSIFLNTHILFTKRFLIAGGATLFFISDIGVAIQAFVKKSFALHVCGLPLYYAGQFMLAFSLTC